MRMLSFMIRTTRDRKNLAGMRLGPAELALLAHVGHTSPRVLPAVRAIHFTTGDELVDPGLYVALPPWGAHVFTVAPG